MTTAEIRGLDVSLFRDGRPFTADSGGGTIQSFSIPAPQTVAGFVRTQIGKAQSISWDDTTAVSALRDIEVLGPILLRDGLPVYPAPRDAAITKASHGAVPQATWLKPEPVDSGCFTNAPAGVDVLAIPQLGKPEPGFTTWTQAAMLRWLESPASPVPAEGVELPPHDERMHVSIDRKTLAGEAGKLFGVSYTGWESRSAGEHLGFHRWSLGVALPDGVTFEPHGAFGGENRVAVMEPGNDAVFAPPSSLFGKLSSSTSIRLILATPALFDAGWYATWMNGGTIPGTSIRVRLRAAATGRRQAITGWDYHLRQPKAVQLAVPAGSVYFLDILSGSASGLAEAAWLRSVSSSDAARRDGFGLALWGIWK